MTIHTKPSEDEALPYRADLLPMAEAIKALKDLKARGVELTDEPETLRSDQIDTLENVFQAREGSLNERHLGELEAAIKANGTIEPLLLWRCGTYAFLIDGHHRLKAYRRVERARKTPIDIPVVWFEGTVEEAAVRAATANSRAKLPMSSVEKLNHAWRMVLSEVFTAKQITEAASVSRRTVFNMKKVMGQLGENSAEHGTWRRAQQAAEGREGWTPEDAEALVEAQAKHYADRLAKEFTTKLATNPVIAAKALAIYFNRKSMEVMRAWQEEIGEAWEEDEEDEEQDY